MKTAVQPECRQTCDLEEVGGEVGLWGALLGGCVSLARDMRPRVGREGERLRAR